MSLSHMRGHVADMDRVMEICKKYDIKLIEDCAHTMGGKWGSKEILVGRFGNVSCFSAQTYKHINAGEGGLLITDDDDIIAKAILHSDSNMLYEKHISKPSIEVFEKYRNIIPNFSLRMSNLVAFSILGELLNLEQRCEQWNARYILIESVLRDVKTIRIPKRF